jgi:uncharacterized protein
MSELLRIRIQDAIKDAMRSKNEMRLLTLRMLMSDIKKADIDKRVDAASDREQSLLNDAEILAVINRMIKQRLDAADQFTKAQRPELAAKEHAEVAILREYLPEQLTEDAIKKLVQTAIDETKAQSSSDMAKVMAFIKEKAQGKADMGKVSALVKSALASSK